VTLLTDSTNVAHLHRFHVSNLHTTVIIDSSSMLVQAVL